MKGTWASRKIEARSCIGHEPARAASPPSLRLSSSCSLVMACASSHALDPASTAQACVVRHGRCSPFYLLLTV